MRVIWSLLAIERVQEISDYIQQDSPDAAEKFVEAIFGEAQRLKDFPNLGRKIPEFPKLPYRELLFEKFRIIYRPGGSEIFVISVRHQKQLLPLEEVCGSTKF